MSSVVSLARIQITHTSWRPGRDPAGHELPARTEFYVDLLVGEHGGELLWNGESFEEAWGFAVDYQFEFFGGLAPINNLVPAAVRS